MQENNQTAASDTSAAELAAVLGVAEDGIKTIQTNKGPITLQEFDVFGVAMVSKWIGESPGINAGLSFLGGGGATSDATVLTGLLKSGDEVLKIIALSAGFLTRENEGTDEWRSKLLGIRSRYIIELLEGVYEVNQFFFVELSKAFNLTATRVAGVALQMLLGIVERLTENVKTPIVPNEATPTPKEADAPPSDGEISLTDLRAAAGLPPM